MGRQGGAVGPARRRHTKGLAISWRGAVLRSSLTRGEGEGGRACQRCSHQRSSTEAGVRAGRRWTWGGRQGAGEGGRA
jgi:hypothetical protein